MPQKRKDATTSTMILVFIIVLVIMACVGCTTAVPVSAKFPDAPSKLSTTACPNLQQLNDGAKLSDVANTVTMNYGTYYECAVKVDTWIEWYEIQRRIYENAGK